MRNPGGYSIVTAPGDKPFALRFDPRAQWSDVRSATFEADTFTCFHCAHVTHVRPRMDAADLGGLCKICMKLICSRCVGKGCDPLEEKLKRSEDKDRFRRSLMCTE